MSWYVDTNRCNRRLNIQSSYFKSGFFLNKNLELHMKSSDAMLKNEILVSYGIELPAFDKRVAKCYRLIYFHFNLCFSTDFSFHFHLISNI